MKIDPASVLGHHAVTAIGAGAREITEATMGRSARLALMGSALALLAMAACHRRSEPAAETASGAAAVSEAPAVTTAHADPASASSDSSSSAPITEASNGGGGGGSGGCTTTYIGGGYQPGMGGAPGTYSQGTPVQVCSAPSIAVARAVPIAARALPPPAVAVPVAPAPAN
jgi:hypothetical protein